MSELVYRITQVADSAFEVERLRLVPHYESFWPWVKPRWEETWESLHPTTVRRVGMPAFLTQQAAQKWIDDKRKYPIVVKQNA